MQPSMQARDNMSPHTPCPIDTCTCLGTTQYGRWAQDTVPPAGAYRCAPHSPRTSSQPWIWGNIAPCIGHRIGRRASWREKQRRDTGRAQRHPSRTESKCRTRRLKPPRMMRWATFGLCRAKEATVVARRLSSPQLHPSPFRHRHRIGW